MAEIPTDDEIEVIDDDDFENEIPTVVEIRCLCPGCGGDQFRMEDYDQPPASHEQAWRQGPLHEGEPIFGEGACRGNRFWDWCRRHEEYGHVGTLTIKSENGKGGMRVFFFPDRRIEARPVTNDRRKR